MMFQWDALDALPLITSGAQKQQISGLTRKSRLLLIDLYNLVELQQPCNAALLEVPVLGMIQLDQLLEQPISLALTQPLILTSRSPLAPSMRISAQLHQDNFRSHSELMILQPSRFST